MNPTGNPSGSKAGFAGLYLERYGSGLVSGLPEPDPDLFLIVTIPAFKEPDLTGSLMSLLACDPPGVKWEILININYPENADSEVVAISRQSLEEVAKVATQLKRSDVRIHCLWNPDMPKRHAGVGLARKIAMDEAVRRFNYIGRPDGVILAFDADSSCDKNYLQRVSGFYLHNRSVRTANICFEHPLNGPDDAKIYHSIAQYELYLRYMRLAVGYTGHPHCMHTVGSSFSVRCKTYIRVNGMGRDRAGEDFYFLHKCILLKGFWEINDTVVRPSARESDRVSFGTGASVHQLQNETVLEVYNFDSFLPLKNFFGGVGRFWQILSEAGNLEGELELLTAGLSEFLYNQEAISRIRVMHRDSASADTFRDKFFAWFNGFMVLRYLNEVHKEYYVKAPVTAEATRLAQIEGIPVGQSAEELLINFRAYEKGKGNRRII